jgi:hypothetical protein
VGVFTLAIWTDDKVPDETKDNNCVFTLKTTGDDWLKKKFPDGCVDEKQFVILLVLLVVPLLCCICCCYCCFCRKKKAGKKTAQDTPVASDYASTV